MKYVIRVIIVLAAVFAAFCAFLAIMERVSSHMSYGTEEPADSGKIQFDMDEEILGI